MPTSYFPRQIQWQPQPKGPNLGGYLAGAILFALVSVIFAVSFVHHSRWTAQYHRECADFTWRGTGSGSTVCYADSAFARYDTYRSSQGLNLSSARWSREYVALPYDFSGGIFRAKPTAKYSAGATACLSSRSAVR